jgi:hypothetical protein
MIDNAILAMMLSQKKEGEDPKKMPLKSDPIKDQFDVRDGISAMVGKGYTALSDDDARGIYKNLSGKLGESRAQKLMNSVFLYNKKSKQTNLEAKLSEFYNSKTGDKDVDEIINTSNKIGYGPLEGFRTSVLVDNQKLQGKFKEADKSNPGAQAQVQNVVNKL